MNWSLMPLQIEVNRSEEPGFSEAGKWHPAKSLIGLLLTCLSTTSFWNGVYNTLITILIIEMNSWDDTWHFGGWPLKVDSKATNLELYYSQSKSACSQTTVGTIFDNVCCLYHVRDGWSKRRYLCLSCIPRLTPTSEQNKKVNVFEISVL